MIVNAIILSELASFQLVGHLMLAGPFFLACGAFIAARIKHPILRAILAWPFWALGVAMLVGGATLSVWDFGAPIVRWGWGSFH
jgi:hypothetical protein